MTQMTAKLTVKPDRRGWRGALGLHDRGRRVTILVFGIVALSLADLAVTIAYLKAHSMIEANPIAAWLIRYTQSPWTLTAFKVATMGICVCLLYRVRRHLAGEVAAWFAIAVLVVLSVMWHAYSNHLEQPGNAGLVQAAPDEVRLGLP